MIREATGDILAADVEAIVNPVNTVGVMGAGLALQFKRKYPDMFAQYAAACRTGWLRTGRVLIHYTCAENNPLYIVSFPTKEDWRNPSKPEWIAHGLTELASSIQKVGIKSIAIPPLGCGLGGLDWDDVRALIVTRLGDIPQVDVVLYAPLVP